MKTSIMLRKTKKNLNLSVKKYFDFFGVLEECSFIFVFITIISFNHHSTKEKNIFTYSIRTIAAAAFCRYEYLTK